MTVTADFREFVLEQLRPLQNVSSRPMFGGVGIYADELFFAIIADDVVYLKVDDKNRGDYEVAGKQPFKPFPDRPSSMNYYELPVEVLEDPEQLLDWSRKAVEAAARSKKKKKVAGSSKVSNEQ